MIFTFYVIYFWFIKTLIFTVNTNKLHKIVIFECDIGHFTLLFIITHHSIHIYVK